MLTKQEVKSLLVALDGVHWLMASTLYGAGLRLMECLRLRVKDTDCNTRQIVVREEKGDKDRITVLPTLLTEPLLIRLERVHILH